MLEWVYRGLRRGRVTTGYPHRDEEPFLGFRGHVDVIGDGPVSESVCPTGAITVQAGDVALDRRRCIMCGECVARYPERFAFHSTYETAEGVVRERRRSVHVRHVDAGSDGAEEWEIQALTNPYYDVQRLGIFFTASPRHADILLVTGGVTEPMREPLLRTWAVMPAPKAVVAVGTDACSGGLSGLPGVGSVLDVDVHVPGSPPSPIAILHGILLAMKGLA
ncbi:MAG TPA: ferredoxin [Solirubrobacter sp.]|nr:ferredoxin [Solirubrobacter sp.]